MVIVIDTREQHPLDFSFWKDVKVQSSDPLDGKSSFYTVTGV